MLVPGISVVFGLEDFESEVSSARLEKCFTSVLLYLGGCQNYGPLLGPLNTRCRVILRTQKAPQFWQPPIGYGEEFHELQVPLQGVPLKEPEEDIGCTRAILFWASM